MMFLPVISALSAYGPIMRGMEQPRYRLRMGTEDDVATAVAIDDAASDLYAKVGIVFDSRAVAPMAAAEQKAWLGAARAGGLLIAACVDDGSAVGFAALTEKDGAAYLEQVSVVPAHMRRGVGRLLLQATCDLARRGGHREIWLTTYRHVPWNRPFYARHGFVVVAEEGCGAGIRAALALQRSCLPQPAARIAMRRILADSGAAIPG
jgi:GNAT superfamily N-acetyltransferase